MLPYSLFASTIRTPACTGHELTLDPTDPFRDMKARRAARSNLSYSPSPLLSLDEVVEAQLQTLSSDALPALLDGGGLIKLSQKEMRAMALHPDYKDIPLDFLPVYLTEKLVEKISIEPNPNRRSGFKAPNDKYSQGWTLAGVHFKKCYSIADDQLSQIRRLWPLLGSGDYHLDKVRLGFHHVHKVLFSLHYLDSKIAIDFSNVPLYEFFFNGKRLYRLTRETERMFDEFRTSQAMFYWLKFYKFFYNIFCEGSTVMIARISRAFKASRAKPSDAAPVHRTGYSFTGSGLDLTKPVTSPVRSKVRRPYYRERPQSKNLDSPVNHISSSSKKKKFETQMLKTAVSDTPESILELIEDIPMEFPVPIKHLHSEKLPEPPVPKGWFESVVDNAKDFVSNTISDAALKTLSEMPSLLAKGVANVVSQGTKSLSSFLSYMMTIFKRLLSDLYDFVKTLYDKIDAKFVAVLCMILLSFVIYQNRQILSKVSSFIPFLYTKIGKVIFNVDAGPLPDFAPLLNSSDFHTQMGFSTLVPLISTAVSIAFATIDKSYLISSNAIVNFMSRAPQVASGVEQSLKDVFDYCYFAYYKEHFFLDKVQHDRMKQFYDDYLAFTSGKSDDQLLHEIRVYGNITESLEKLHARAVAVKADLPYSKHLGPFAATLARVVNDVVKLHQDALSSANYYKTRIETPLIWLYGKPGQGKTALIPRLSHAIYQYVQHMLKDPKYSDGGESHVLCSDYFSKAFTLGMLYNRSTVDPFWEGYEQQFCCVWNELFACADPKTNMLLANELLTACEKGTYSLNMAFEGKGRCFFSSLLAFVTSNVTDHTIRNGMCLSEPAALVRRRTLCLEVEKDEQFVLERKLKTNSSEFEVSGNYDKAWKMTLRYPTDQDFQEAFKLGVPSPWKEHAMSKGSVEMRFTDVVMCIGDAILSRMVSHARDTSELTVNHLPPVLARMNNLPEDHPIVAPLPEGEISTPEVSGEEPKLPPKPVVPDFVKNLGRLVALGDLSARQFAQATGQTQAFEAQQNRAKKTAAKAAVKVVETPVSPPAQKPLEVVPPKVSSIKSSSKTPKSVSADKKQVLGVKSSRKPDPPPKRKTTAVVPKKTPVKFSRVDTPTVSISEAKKQADDEMYDMLFPYADGLTQTEFMQQQEELALQLMPPSSSSSVDEKLLATASQFNTQMFLVPKWLRRNAESLLGIEPDVDGYIPNPLKIGTCAEIALATKTYDGAMVYSSYDCIKWPREQMDYYCSRDIPKMPRMYGYLHIPHIFQSSFWSSDREKRLYTGRILKMYLRYVWSGYFAHPNSWVIHTKFNNMIKAMNNSLGLNEHPVVISEFLDKVLHMNERSGNHPFFLMLQHLRYLCRFSLYETLDDDDRYPDHIPRDDDWPSRNLHMFDFLTYRRTIAITRSMKEDKYFYKFLDEFKLDGETYAVFGLRTLFSKAHQVDNKPQSFLYDRAMAARVAFDEFRQTFAFSGWLTQVNSTTMLVAGFTAMISIMVGGLVWGIKSETSKTKSRIVPESKHDEIRPDTPNQVLNSQSLTRDKTSTIGKGTLHPHSLTRDKVSTIGKATLHSQLQRWGGPFLRQGEYPSCENGFCYCNSGEPPCTIQELWSAAEQCSHQEHTSWSKKVYPKCGTSSPKTSLESQCFSPLHESSENCLLQIPKGFEWSTFPDHSHQSYYFHARLVPIGEDPCKWVGELPLSWTCNTIRQFPRDRRRLLNVPYFLATPEVLKFPVNTPGYYWVMHGDRDIFWYDECPEEYRGRSSEYFDEGLRTPESKKFCPFEDRDRYSYALNPPRSYKNSGISTQSGIDSQINILASHIRGLAITVLLDGVPQILKQYGIISGHRIFTSAHFMDQHSAPSYLSVMNHGNAVLDFLGNQVTITRAPGDRDVAYIDLPKTVNAFPSIKSKMFESRSVLSSQFSSANVIFRVRRDGGIVYREDGQQSLVDLPTQYGSHTNPDYRLSGHYGVTQMDGFNGYCGLPYFTYSKEGKVIFLGIHVGASGSSPGAMDSYFSPLFQTDFPVFETQCKMPGWLEIGTPNTSNPDLLFDQQTILLGSVKPKYMPTKTMLVPSPAQGNLGVPPCYPSEVTPATLAPNKAAGYHPLKHTMPKLNKAHCRPLPNRLAHYALHEPDRLFAGWFPKHMNRERLREWTIWEALFGEQVSGWTGTEQSTAVGPDIEHCLPGVTSLFQLWGRVDDDYWKNKLPKSIKDLKLVRKDDMWIHPVLFKLVMDLFVIIADGHEPKNVVAGCHKDELRPDGKKLPDGNVVPRLFCIGSKSHQIATIMVMGSLVMNMKSNRSTSDVAIGDNPHGFDWKRLLAKLNFTDEEICFGGGDVSGMDTSERSWMGWLLGYACCRVFGYVPGTFNYNKVMAFCKTALAPLLIIFDSIYWMDYYNSSGGWLTGFLNSFCSIVMFNYSLMICQDDSNDEEFKKAQRDAILAAIFYGDDNVWTILKKFIEFFNMIIFAKIAFDVFGITYTTPSKGAIIAPHSPLSELTFLARSFRRDGERVFAPLEPSSIYGMVLWVKKPKKSATRAQINAQFCENVETAMKEWFHHGREKFDLEEQRLSEVCRQNGLPYLGKSFAHYESRWLAGFQ